MLNVIRNKISLTRGDTASFKINLKNEKNEAYELSEDDKLVFTLKDSTISDEVLIQKITENGEFKIHPEDTSHLKYGNYVYDVQITTANGDVFTVIPPTIFEVMSEVNFDV